MKADRKLPVRKQLRYPSFDYSSRGSYFLTICSFRRQQLFSEIVLPHDSEGNARVVLSSFGTIIEKQLLEMSEHYEDLSLEQYVIMPNHIHLLVSVLSDREGETRANELIPAYISTLKRFTNKHAGRELWQKGYHDHVIRGEKDFIAISDYISYNPSRWVEDRYYE